ncbi:PEP-CTERM sorting domain-containing protein [Aeoliella straminimaris]
MIGNPTFVPEATTLHLLLGGIGLVVCWRYRPTHAGRPRPVSQT